MSESGDKLALALAELLTAVVPAGFGVSVMNGVLTVRFVGRSVSASTHVAEIVDLHAGTEGVSIAALQSLSTVQDFVSETTADPWPRDSSKGSSYMALPQCHVAGNRLHVWFGEPTQVAVDVGVVDVPGGAAS